MKICIATGGTGGHIYPALALADEIKQKEPSSRFLFIGSESRMESKEIPDAGYPFIGIKVTGTNGGLMNKINSVLGMSKAYFDCKKILKKEKPELVIGFGNYISVPVVLAAHHLKIPTMIHEQNSFAGKANIFLAKFVDGIIGCYEENLEQFPKNKTRILGNPRSSIAKDVKKDSKIVESFGLSTKLPLVIVVMGSLGSESVNDVMINALNELKDKKIQLLYVTGKKHYDDFKKHVSDTELIKVVPYIDGCKVMVNADLCIVRGGATTAAEITALKMPSIIIPSPYVPNNHQVMNALALQNAGAAIMIEEKDLTTETILSTIDKVLSNSILKENMSLQAAKCAKTSASSDIYDWMKVIKGEFHG